MALSPNLQMLIGKRWNPNQRQAENVLRLVLAESPNDFDEVCQMVRDRGLTVPDDIAPARGWRDLR